MATIPMPLDVRLTGPRRIDATGTALCLCAGLFFAWRGATALAPGATADGGTAAISLASGTLLLLGAWRLSPKAKRTLGGYAVALIIGLVLLSAMLTGDAAARQVDALDRASLARIVAFQDDAIRLRLALPAPSAAVVWDADRG